jgi:hypothetical protein
MQGLDRVQRGEVLFFRQPALRPGTYTLEVAVGDALTLRAGVHRSTFVVPEITQSLQVSSVVIVQRAEHVKGEQRGIGNPLYAGDLLVYPNLGEPIRPSQDNAVPFYVMIRLGPGPAPQATVEVLREAQVVGQTAVILSVPDTSGQIKEIGQLSVERLPAGHYMLRLTVTQGERREVRNATFDLVK